MEIQSLVENMGKLSGKADGNYVFPNSVLSECDVENENGRIYSKKLWEQVISQVTPKLENRTLIGELDHPDPETPEGQQVMLKNASHVITEMGIGPEGQLIGNVELLSTPAGKVARALHDSGVPLHVSSRAQGTTTVRDGKVWVNEDTYKFQTFDLVADPSFVRARLSEGKADSLDKMIKELVEENPSESEEIVRIFESIQANSNSETANEAKELPETPKVTLVGMAESSLLNSDLGKRIKEKTVHYADVLALKTVFNKDIFKTLMESQGINPEDFDVTDFENLDSTDKVMMLQEQVSQLRHTALNLSAEVERLEGLEERSLALKEIAQSQNEQNETLKQTKQTLEKVADNLDQKPQQVDESKSSNPAQVSKTETKDEVILPPVSITEKPYEPPEPDSLQESKNSPPDTFGDDYLLLQLVRHT